MIQILERNCFLLEFQCPMALINYPKRFAHCINEERLVTDGAKISLMLSVSFVLSSIDSKSQTLLYLALSLELKKQLSL